MIARRLIQAGQTCHARRINCSFLLVLLPPLPLAWAFTLQDRELQMNSMIEAPRDLLCIVIAQAISWLLPIAEGIDYNGFTCAALMHVYCIIYDIPYNDRCYHAGIYMIPLHILASTWNWRARGNTMHQVREAW